MIEVEILLPGMLGKILQFLFSLTPPALTSAASTTWAVIAVACVVIATVCSFFVLPRITAAYYRTPGRRLVHALVANGIVLGILLFFRYELVPFFSARFWLLVLVGADIAWAVGLARYLIVKLPAQRATWAAAQEKKKYLRK